MDKENLEHYLYHIFDKTMIQNYENIQREFKDYSDAMIINALQKCETSILEIYQKIVVTKNIDLTEEVLKLSILNEETSNVYLRYFALSEILFEKGYHLPGLLHEIGLDYTGILLKYNVDYKIKYEGIIQFLNRLWFVRGEYLKFKNIGNSIEVYYCKNPKNIVNPDNGEFKKIGFIHIGLEQKISMFSNLTVPFHQLQIETKGLSFVEIDNEIVPLISPGHRLELLKISESDVYSREFISRD